LESTLKQAGDTRWNSHLAMFSSIVINWDSIDASVDSVDNKNEEVRTLLEQLKAEEVETIISVLKVSYI
jgi:hypothetical protein